VQPEDENASGQPGGSADPGNLDRPKPRVRRLLWFSAGFAAAIATVFACAFIYFLGPAQAPGRDVVVLIRPGMTLPAIASELEARGLIRNAQTFVLLAKLQNNLGAAKAGEFLLSSGWTPQEILRVITSTSGIQHKVVVREGLPWWSAARLFEAQGLTDEQSFAQAMQNATLLQKYAIPGANAEGFLFPQTYQLPRAQADNATIVVETMLKEFDRQAKKLWPQGPPPAQELLRIVTLASLVERETGDAAERPRIAGVFANRLRLGMRLQCDPTTIYGLGPAFDGDLKRAHLEDANNLYNTYAHAGLPPGPICSPGLESLKAAISPEAHDFIYFVARGDGTHEFSATLDEHNRAVNRFQRRRDPESYRSAPQAAAQSAGPALLKAVQPAPQAKAKAPQTEKRQAAPKKPAVQKTQPSKTPPAKAQAVKNATAKAAEAQRANGNAAAPKP
jgi:UPF0755 protein